MAAPSPPPGPRNSTARRALLWATWVLSAAAGLWFGYGFGERLGGVWVGVVAALNGAFFCSVVAGAAADRLLRGPSHDATRPR